MMQLSVHNTSTYAQLEQTQEMAVLQDSARLKQTVDQQICPQFNMLSIDDLDLQEVWNKVFPARHKWYIIGIQLGMKADDLDAIK